MKTSLQFKPRNRHRREAISIGPRQLSRLRLSIDTAASRLRSVADSDNISNLRFTVLSTARQLEALRLPR